MPACPCRLTGVFGGFLLGVRSNSGLAFYDWETCDLIRRIEIQPKHVRPAARPPALAAPPTIGGAPL